MLSALPHLVWTQLAILDFLGFITFGQSQPEDADLMADIHCAAFEAIGSPLNIPHSAANDDDRCDPAREIADLKHQAWQFAQALNIDSANLRGPHIFALNHGFIALYFTDDEVGAFA